MSNLKPEDEFILIELWHYIKKIDRSWLFTWGAIFATFLTTDALSHLIYGETFIGTTAVKYCGILLTVVYAHKKFPKDYLLQIALLFTLLADTILVVDSTSPIGVFVFCIAQYFHVARFAGTETKFFILWTLTILGVFYLGIESGQPPIYFLGLIYAVSLAMNIYLASRWVLRTKKYLATTAIDPKAEPLMSSKAAVKPKESIKVKLTSKEHQREVIASACALSGFILFACCDFCVALSFLSHVGLIPSVLYDPMNYVCWAFYYPSQVLISNSSSMDVAKPKKRKPLFSFAKK